jgi:hypothetical protein
VLFGAFHHGHTFARYLANIFIDSLFSTHPQTKAYKQQACSTLVTSFQNEVLSAQLLLREYHHLVDTDDVDCELDTQLTHG